MPTIEKRVVEITEPEKRFSTPLTYHRHGFIDKLKILGIISTKDGKTFEEINDPTKQVWFHVKISHHATWGSCSNEWTNHEIAYDGDNWALVENKKIVSSGANIRRLCTKRRVPNISLGLIDKLLLDYSIRNWMKRNPWADIASKKNMI